MKRINSIKRGFGVAFCIALAVIMLALSACNSVNVEETEPAEKPTEAPVMVSVLRARENVMAGTGLGVKSVEVVELDKNTLPEGYLTKVTDVTGRKLLVDVAVGDIITEAMLEAKADDPNKNEENDVNTETARERGYVVVTDGIKINPMVDIADELQKIINDNPGATIYFPDGTYTIAKSIMTSSDPEKAVSLYLSNFAIIKADNNWSEENGHMIRLGALDAEKSSRTSGFRLVPAGGCGATPGGRHPNPPYTVPSA